MQVIYVLVESQHLGRGGNRRVSVAEAEHARADCCAQVEPAHEAFAFSEYVLITDVGALA